ncbi:hypothetical protein V1264_018177 [Littorina saxatilis]|uniref:Uncharacterized protein n=1 Tax=Littorina saxatilis TaxID=31220 RepID=A0AAN9GD62_9CAEN
MVHAMTAAINCQRMKRKVWCQHLHPAHDTQCGWFSINRHTGYPPDSAWVSKERLQLTQKKKDTAVIRPRLWLDYMKSL